MWFDTSSFDCTLDSDKQNRISICMPTMYTVLKETLSATKLSCWHSRRYPLLSICCRIYGIASRAESDVPPSWATAALFPWATDAAPQSRIWIAILFGLSSLEIQSCSPDQEDCRAKLALPQHSLLVTESRRSCKDLQRWGGHGQNWLSSSTTGYGHDLWNKKPISRNPCTGHFRSVFSRIAARQCALWKWVTSRQLQGVGGCICLSRREIRLSKSWKLVLIERYLRFTRVLNLRWEALLSSTFSIEDCGKPKD